MTCSAKMSGAISFDAKRAQSRVYDRVFQCSLRSVKACQGKVGVCQEVKVLSPDMFDIYSKFGRVIGRVGGTLVLQVVVLLTLLSL